tara:strand:- start:226 stop:468 length:243 start_codon:yes stop_codon:yes gene_type:complete
MNIYEIMIRFLNEVESKDSNVTIAGGHGYSIGKAYPSKGVGVMKMLGKDPDADLEEEENESSDAPVKVSKVFFKEKENNV